MENLLVSKFLSFMEKYHLFHQKTKIMSFILIIMCNFATDLERTTIF